MDRDIEVKQLWLADRRIERAVKIIADCYGRLTEKPATWRAQVHL
jgi:hypothetical protein